MIKNIIFDVGYVLVDFRWRELMKDLDIPKDVQEIFADKVFGSPWWNELDRGVIDEDEVVNKLREENSPHYNEFDLIWANRDKIVKPYDYAVGMIETLRARGFKVYLLSNNPESLFELHTKCGHFPFVDKVDGKVVSGVVKMVKPDSEIYEYLLKTYDLKAEECVFLDDREENVEAAKKVGINGILFEGYEQAWAELNKKVQNP